LIKVNGVWHKYDSRWILRGVSLALRDGAIIVLVGPNASGKTTLLKIMAGIIKPSRGTVLIDGLDPWRLKEPKRTYARRSTVYVSEKPVMVRGSVRDNILLGLRVRGLDVEAGMENASNIIEYLGLSTILDSKALSLSAGQRQLVSIARALLLEPKHILLDEPLAHLDRVNRVKVLKLLRRLADDGKAIMMATHDPYNMEDIADERITIEDGRIISMD